MASGTASGTASGAGVEDLELFSGGAGASGGLETFGATDSRRGLDDAAVTVDCAVAGVCVGNDSWGDFSGVGVVTVGVDGWLASFVVVLLTFGVAGPAGASGICTVIAFVDFNASGSGTGVFETGDGASDKGSSMGVEAIEAGVAEGDVVALNPGTLSCSRARLGSG